MLNPKYYSEIKCPKCGKKHFRVKSNSYQPIADIFRIVEDPIYKDGVLQNPRTPKPQIERFECKECGCNFRAEIETINGISVVSKIIDEDKEQEEKELEYKKYREELEAKKKAEEEKKKEEIIKYNKEHPDSVGLIYSSGDAISTTAALSSISLADIPTYSTYAGTGDKSEIDLGGYIIKSNKTYTEEQIKNIKETFGFEVRNNEKI